MTFDSISLNTALAELRAKGFLCVRSINALTHAGLNTVEDVVGFLQSGGTLLTIRNMKKKNKTEAKDFFLKLFS